jgi:hypothetical protein
VPHLARAKQRRSRVYAVLEKRVLPATSAHGRSRPEHQRNIVLRRGRGIAEGAPGSLSHDHPIDCITTNGRQRGADP